MPSLTPVEAAIEFLESDHAKNLMGLAKIRVGGELLDRQAIAAVLRVAVLTNSYAARAEFEPLPDTTHERRAFYQDAMRRENNHAALAFELAYLRHRVDNAKVPVEPPSDKQMVESAWFYHRYARGTKEAVAFNNGARWRTAWDNAGGMPTNSAEAEAGDAP